VRRFAYFDGDLLMRRRSRRSASKLIVKAAELSWAAPQVVAFRTLGMLAGGAFPGARQRRENIRMGTEKIEAYTDAVTAMSAQMVRSNVALMTYLTRQWWTGWMQPGSWFALPKTLQRQLNGAALSVANKGVSPMHRRAVANARRLRRGG
jgi:hypothetical protein